MLIRLHPTLWFRTKEVQAPPVRYLETARSRLRYCVAKSVRLDQKKLRLNRYEARIK